MIPYTNERGRRAYRPSALGRALAPPRPRWPWLVLVGFGLGLVIGGLR